MARINPILARKENCTAPHKEGELELFEVKLGGWPIVIAQFTTRDQCPLINGSILSN